jgi:hypothetical protein
MQTSKLVKRIPSALLIHLGALKRASKLALKRTLIAEMDVLRCRKTDVRKMEASPDSKDGSGWMKRSRVQDVPIAQGTRNNVGTGI